MKKRKQRKEKSKLSDFAILNPANFGTFPSPFDPMGNYTGMPTIIPLPEQDADDL